MGGLISMFELVVVSVSEVEGDGEGGGWFIPSAPCSVGDVATVMAHRCYR